jgi:hypothetical protein
MNRRALISTLSGVLVAMGMAIACVPVRAWAQDPATMTCEELWYQRNEIYARKGYCFRTERARAVFGPGCFPPYGQLSNWESRRVAELQMWERRRDCP